MLPLQDQVCNLELSKRLKELGVKQESLFLYDMNGILCSSNANWDMAYCISAFTVAELGELLPVRDYLTEGIVKDKEDLANWSTFKSDGKWHCNLTWRYSRDKVESIKADSEADARAKMLIYLLENKLIPNPKTE